MVVAVVGMVVVLLQGLEQEVALDMFILHQML